MRVAHRGCKMKTTLANIYGKHPPPPPSVCFSINLIKLIRSPPPPPPGGPEPHWRKSLKIFSTLPPVAPNNDCFGFQIA